MKGKSLPNICFQENKIFIAIYIKITSAAFLYKMDAWSKAPIHTQIHQSFLRSIPAFLAMASSPFFSIVFNALVDILSLTKRLPASHQILLYCRLTPCNFFVLWFEKDTLFALFALLPVSGQTRLARGWTTTVVDVATSLAFPWHESLREEKPLPLSSSELAEDREEAFVVGIDGFWVSVVGRMHDARRLSRTVAIAG